ncbi:MAG: hypothetical protein Kow00109_12720 [Acidobacteriota bacterium]
MRTGFRLLAWLVFGGIVAWGAAWDVPDRPSGDARTEDLALFHFVRIRYHGFGGFGFWGNNWVEPWAHDYPRAEQNFLKILQELTMVPTREDAYLILDLEDPRIMDYPILYVSEPGYWDCTDREVENLREYLLRGGFVIFDDFRDAPGEWAAFSTCMQKVLPERPLELLTIEHPIFHCFYDIATLDMVPPYNVPGRPQFFGITDEQGRLQVIAAFNNDIGDYWEWSDQSFVPIQLSNEAYKFGVNFVIYGLTH